MSSEEEEESFVSRREKIKHAAKFTENDQDSLLSSGEDLEYTNIFQELPVQPLISKTAFDEGESVSASDEEINGFSGDIETYIGNDDEFCEPTIVQREAQLISLTDEKVCFVNEESKYEHTPQASLNNITEIAKQLHVTRVTPKFKPGKPVKIVSDAEASLMEHSDILRSSEDELTSSVEMFDPLAIPVNTATDGMLEGPPMEVATPREDKTKARHAARKKRPRHRIYLDDPDIHQLINEQVEMLRQLVAGGQVAKKKSPASQSHHTGLPDISFRGPAKPVHRNPQHRQIAGMTVSPYRSHNIRGKDIVSRIRQVNTASSDDDDDDDDYTQKLIAKDLAKTGRSRSGYEMCPECGEEHSDDNDADDDNLCPDCGMRHNPYKHPPNMFQKPWRDEQPCNKPKYKSGKRYEQVSTEQDNEDVGEDSLPSIEGPHTIQELSVGYRYKLKYLGSCQIITQHPVTKETRMQQAQDAYSRIKAQDDDEEDLSTNVDMCISLERIKILNKDTKFEDVMMDHALRTVCFICDMGNILVLMARRLTSEKSTDILMEDGRPITLGTIVGDREKKTSKNICHVFECQSSASTIAKAIGQAFNFAYRQFLQSNGISHEHVEEAEYCHVLESQKLVGTDLDKLTDQSAVRDVVVVKKRGEPLGIMLLESGWGSMLPTVFVAHIANYSATAQSQRISVGDHLLACNGASLVGLPLSECTTVLKNCRSSNRVTFRVVSCPPVVDVVVSRPDVKYQLGFSVQNGTICSLLRGGIAERGGVRVGHRIIEINGDSVVAKPHQHIVDILASTIGTISMKTMPIAMYRLMVGDDLPQHV